MKNIQGQSARKSRHTISRVTALRSTCSIRRQENYVWDVCKKNYYDYGINAFWLDNSEPDYGVYDFDHYRYIEGPALSCSNIYPQLYSRVFYDKKKKPTA